MNGKAVCNKTLKSENKVTSLLVVCNIGLDDALFDAEAPQLQLQLPVMNVYPMALTCSRNCLSLMPRFTHFISMHHPNTENGYFLLGKFPSSIFTSLSVKYNKDVTETPHVH